MRLALARKRRGLKMSELATLIKVQPRTISAYENGEFAPSEETLGLIAKELGFPIQFFYGSDVEMPSTHATSFRALSRMKASDRDAALGAATIGVLVNEWLEREFQLPTSSVPDLNFEDPEPAAESVRSEWMLGYRSLNNIIHLLEAKGVRVFSLPRDLAGERDHGIDAFSFWRGNTPYMFLNTDVTAERMRFDCAHELGHLVMHKHGGPDGQDAESEANAFASALLIPASSVYATIKRPVTLGKVISWKKKWGVSASALAYRLWKLTVLSDWQYRSMIIEIKSSFGKTEPHPMPHESSQVVTKIFSGSAGEGVTKNQVARDLSVTRADIEELTFGLTVAEGGNKDGVTGRGRAKLTVVKYS